MVRTSGLGQIWILRSFEKAQRRIASLYTNIVLLWLVVVSLSFGLTYLLARRIVEPVKQLDRAAAEAESERPRESVRGWATSP